MGSYSSETTLPLTCLHVFSIEPNSIIYFRVNSFRVCPGTGSLSRLASMSQGYKNMLNSAAHEILNAHKYKHIKKFCILLAQISLECYFFFS